MSLQIRTHYHRMEIKNIDKVKKNRNLIKVRKKPSPKTLKKQIQTIDSLKKDTEIIDSVSDTLTVARKVNDDAKFFKDLAAMYYAARDNSDEGAMSRSDIVIRYYKKNNDKNRVYKLRDLGFYIHERPAELDFDDYTSNAIFYGDSVKREDLIMIAYHLLENGVKLQSIKLSKFHDAWKAHSVEIGTDTTALNKKPLTLSSLRKKWAEM